MAQRRSAVDDRPAIRARLLRHLTVVASANPNVWRRVDEIRAVRSRQSPSPSWCFLPFSTLTKLGCEFPGIPPKSSYFEGLAAWRPTQGIYVFDSLLLDELSGTITDEPIPGEVILRVPEWCIYLTSATGSLGGTWGLCGCFAFLSYDDSIDQPLLRFLLDFGDDSLLATLPIPLNGVSIAEGVQRSCADMAHILRTADRREALCELAEIDLTAYTCVVTPLVNLVVYICSVNSDIVGFGRGGQVPRHPTAVRTRRGVRLFPPSDVTVWQVGTRISAAIRVARASGQTGGMMRPHVRRAHWHTFWTGSRSQPDTRTMCVKWLPPILVNTDEAGGAPAFHLVTANSPSN
jgi:hypothetical protein